MIWIVGGTGDSREITGKLLERTDERIIVTTATSYGEKLLEEYKDRGKGRIETISERLDEKQMKELIISRNITAVIDASHPYAVNVSRSVIKVTGESGVKYIRFERKMLEYGNENIERFSSLKEMKVYMEKFENRNILSTLGSNNLAEIKEMGEKNNLYIRILPTASSVQKAEELGYAPSKIIAIQGPVGKKLNKAILESYNINFLITKESGETGGEREKIDACRECGVTVLVLKRPFLDYGKTYDETDRLIKEEFE